MKNKEFIKYIKDVFNKFITVSNVSAKVKGGETTISFDCTYSSKNRLAELQFEDREEAKVRSIVNSHVIINLHTGKLDDLFITEIVKELAKGKSL